MSWTQADAATLLIRFLRRPDHGEYSKYGYGLYLPALLRVHLEQQAVGYHDAESKLRELMPALYAAAWDLCRRGILRPGVHSYGAQATEDGAGGNGYSLTPFGEQWLKEMTSADFLPTEPERFAETLPQYAKRYSPAFQERSQQAIRCYDAHAYLACCAMCGAAAETILLAAASAKFDPASVLERYKASGGRRKVENMILSQLRNALVEEFATYMTLLKYWRDAAAHGEPSAIAHNEAYASLALLFRFAAFVDANWDELVTPIADDPSEP
jgi:hypothetical protein